MLRLENIHKAYTGFSLEATLEVAQGETVALLGPSGSGKSTLLRLVAGLETPESGAIVFQGQLWNNLPPEQRGVGFVFQDYALFPHLSVYENIAFGLREARVNPDLIDTRVRQLLELTQLTPHQRKSPHALSGGERQRVALARALAILPKVLLLDEPLGALDLKLREELLFELKTLLQQQNIPTLVVTHDQSEAFALAQRVAVMRAGKIVQIDSPEHLYSRPKSEWIARFLGHDNILNPAQSAALGLFPQSHLLPQQALQLGPGQDAQVLERLFLGSKSLLRLGWKGLTLQLETLQTEAYRDGWVGLEVYLDRAVALGGT